MATRSLFPTLVYAAALAPRGAKAFNAQLKHEIRVLRLDDSAGRRWSAHNYPGGYTSYGSASRMHQASPTFAALERKLAPHVRAFSRALGLDLTGRKLSMTDCWVNVMPHRVVHGLHLHPLSTISGTYYVQTPAGSPGIKFEDPRLDRMMAAPPRRARRRGIIWSRRGPRTRCRGLLASARSSGSSIVDSGCDTSPVHDRVRHDVHRAVGRRSLRPARSS